MRRDSSTVRDWSRQFHRFTARIAPFAAIASAILLLWHAARDPVPTVAAAPAPLIYPGARSPAPQPAGIPAAVQQAGLGSTIDVVVGRNDTLDSIFRRFALDKSDLAEIRGLPGIRQSLDLLKPGESIELRHSAGEVNELTRKLSPTETLKVVRRAGGYTAQLVSDPIQTRIRTARAVITSSLFQAAQAARVSDAIALRLAHIFAWDVDFMLDLRRGDRLTIVYQQLFENGKYLRDGKILAAKFVNAGHVYEAVRFVGPDGVDGYYTPSGQPMHKAFLRAPLAFTRVSSAFNLHRMNPILHVIRPHLGTDYAAPLGTPVDAAGDGRVQFVGREDGYGNTVILAHADDITTLYAHLERFARKLHRGETVRQGQVIGYVGMSGLATGPHLHYEYRIGDVHENPQTVRLPGAPPLRGSSLVAFRMQTATWLADLQSPLVGASARTATAANIAPRTVLPASRIAPN